MKERRGQRPRSRALQLPMVTPREGRCGRVGEQDYAERDANGHPGRQVDGRLPDQRRGAASHYCFGRKAVVAFGQPLALKPDPGGDAGA